MTQNVAPQSFPKWQPTHSLIGWLAIAVVCMPAGWIGERTFALENPEELGRPAAVDFKRDIRPILSNRCFACHGPDDQKIESGLRLDSLEAATQPADSGKQAIVPGKSLDSEMIRRVMSQDADERMPPPHFGERLTDTEISKLRQWVDSGAVFTKHWSFDSVVPTPPKPISLPEYARWQESPIDQWILNGLNQKGWRPSPPADKLTLLRRLTIDLTGLPPTVAEQEAFLQDDEPLAVERLVDRLLASPAFGEHWARKWLDLARYADSAGYADDPQRTIWAYRDWVIRAINSGMTFDEFTIQQLAGDLLPNASEDQLIATAFHRNTLTNNEGGTNDEEFRNVAVVDRVNTTMSVWMGVTMACAQCHSHKFDPISQKEYFQVFAILNQSEDADRGDESPTMPWFTPEQRVLKEQLTRELQNLDQELIKPDESLRVAQQEWERKISAPIDWSPIRPSHVTASSEAASHIGESGAIRVDSNADNDKIQVEWSLEHADDARTWSAFAIDTHPDASLPGGGAGARNGNFVLSNVRATMIASETSGVNGRYVRIDLPGSNKILSLAEVQVFSGGDNIALRGTATQSSDDYEGTASRAIDGNTSGVYEKNSTTHTRISDSPWWELDLAKVATIEKVTVWNRTGNRIGERLAGAKVSILDESRQSLFSFTIADPKDSQDIELIPSIEIPWSFATADYEQTGFAGSHAIDSDSKTGWAVGGEIQKGHRLTIAIDRDALLARLKNWNYPAKVRIELDFASPHKQHVLSRFSVLLTRSEHAAAWTKVPRSIQQLLTKDLGQRTPNETSELHRFYLTDIAPERQPIRTRRADVTKQLAELKPATTVPILRDLPKEKQRTTHVQLRGNYRVHGEQVEPGLPVAFHAYRPNQNASDLSNDKKGSLTRLDLAKWLVQSDNPLTARVVANRFWENLFGVGIVRTSEEFGSQGDLPTHPELLDMLANDLVSMNWDTKRFLRQIVLSQAYQQASVVTPARYEEDPENIWVSRGPRFRATAEQIRDQALASAGLLSNRMFGPPTRPPQPSMGLSAAFGSRTDWETSTGENRYRRALYTQWRRSNPYPSMATFDAPNREVCVLKRDRTNTPLQALVTLNDPAFIEAAQGLARRVVVHELPTSSASERLDRIYLHTLARLPFQKERDAILNLLELSKQDLAKTPKEATQLATEPIGPLPANADPVELAAWTTVCNVVLNLDEFLMKP